jgi:hypothetical protein
MNIGSSAHLLTVKERSTAETISFLSLWEQLATLESETSSNATSSAIFNGKRLQTSTFVSSKVCYDLLIKDDVTRMITSVQLDETQSIWTVGAARAKMLQQNLPSGYRKTRCDTYT